MGRAESKAKNSAMASDLVARGIWHGKRTTTPRHNNYPKLTDVGSAAYRRLQDTGRKRDR
jgi:hypothetical protein